MSSDDASRAQLLRLSGINWDHPNTFVSFSLSETSAGELPFFSNRAKKSLIRT